MRTPFKDQQLGITNIAVHPIRKTSGGQQVGASECYLRRRRDPIKLRRYIMGYYGIRLLDESRDGLRRPAQNEV